jgi:hypothetical protein
MERRYTIILAVGLVMCAIFFFIDTYLGGIAAIILIMLGMSFFIMQDATLRPEIGVVLRDDAKGIIVINRGTDVAKKIHVTIVPHNLEFDIPDLAVDARYEYLFSGMISEAKTAVTYQNSQGQVYSQTIGVSALGKSDDDLLKPVFPIFKWK